MRLRVGDTAPDFCLPGIDGAGTERRDYKLSDFRGQPVVLVFYPGDGTPVCTKQLNSYSRDIETFRDVDAQILALSPQSVDSHEAFADDQGGFAFPLLADEDKAVGAEYGVLGPVGFYRRSVFLVDPDGVVRYRHRAVAGLNFRTSEELTGAVRALSA